MTDLDQPGPMDKMIIHTPCGLPVELCECQDAEIYYDWENDVFVERDQPGLAEI